MTAPTHALGGIAMLSFFSLLFPAYHLNIKLIFLGAVSSLMPDVDNPKSFIGRLLFFISGPLERKFGHRTLTHSFLFNILVALISYLSLYLYFGSVIKPLPYAFSISVAYFSHLLFDSMTRQGILAYWPSRLWGVIPKKLSWRIRTGSKLEIIYFFVFAVLSVTFLPLGQSGLISAFNRLFLPGSADFRLQEFKHKKQKASLGFTVNQIDSLLDAGAIDPKQASDLKSGIQDVELLEKKFKRDQAINE